MFQFKQFCIDDHNCGMKISSDSVLLGAWFLPRVADATSILDVGTGSGLLSLMAAQVCSSAAITGIEIDPIAVAACRSNVQASPWPDRIAIIEGDFKSTAMPAFDAIISNPPYFEEDTLAPSATRAAARNQFSLSYADLLNQAAKTLNPGGLLGLIAPAALEDSLSFSTTLAGLNPIEICRVTTSPTKPPKRILCIFGKSHSPLSRTTLSLHSNEYNSLVEPFYIRIH